MIGYGVWSISFLIDFAKQSAWRQHVISDYAFAIGPGKGVAVLQRCFDMKDVFGFFAGVDVVPPLFKFRDGEFRQDVRLCFTTIVFVDVWKDFFGQLVGSTPSFEFGTGGGGRLSE